MQANNRTFTEEARRNQIVDAAIETIAGLGCHKASFAQIAKRAGLSSTGLISYHFANKKELVELVVVRLHSQIRDFMAVRLDGQPNATAALRVYIESNIRFASKHSIQMTALLEIFASGTLNHGPFTDREAVSPLKQILQAGQDSGEFRTFDVRVMATSIHRAIEGPVFLLGDEPTLDLESATDELVTLFERATCQKTQDER